MSNCNCKNVGVTGVVVAVAYFLMEWFFHGTFMMARYQETMELWRPETEMNELMWIGLVGYLLFGLLFAYIFGRGYEAGKSKIGQGLRFGIIIGLLYVGANILGMIGYTPYPNDLYWSWFGIGMIECAVLGVIAGFMYKAN